MTLSEKLGSLLSGHLINKLGLEKKIEGEIYNYNVKHMIEEAIEEALNNLDIDSMVKSEIEDLRINRIVEEGIEDAITNLGLEDKVCEVIDEFVTRIKTKIRGD